MWKVDDSVELREKQLARAAAVIRRHQNALIMLCRAVAQIVLSRPRGCRNCASCSRFWQKPELLNLFRGQG
ncbi:hypothetical protein LUU34_00756600 [Aix galericulata]|nr:hypothetical protein LUU34_00756600 [Aix galericulata]